MPSLFTIAAATATSLVLALQANAHGYVQEVTLGSTKYTGYNPYADPCVSPFHTLGYGSDTLWPQVLQPASSAHHPQDSRQRSGRGPLFDRVRLRFLVPVANV